MGNLNPARNAAESADEYIESAVESPEEESRLSKTEGTSSPLIIAVGGAKGGVGKSFFSSSLSMALAAAGHKTLAVDLDFGGANLHLMFGIRRMQRTLKDFFQKSVSELSELITETAFQNLFLIGGDSTQLGISNHPYQQKLKLIRRLRAEPYDIVVCDLGAGTSFNTLDYFLMGDERFIVTTAEPTSVLDTYAMIKTSLYRRLLSSLKKSEGNPDALKRIEDFLSSDQPGETSSLRAFLPTISESDPETAGGLYRLIRSYRLNLVLNQSVSDGDFLLLRRVLELAKNNLALESLTPMRIPYDPDVPHAVARLRPFLPMKAESQTALSVMEIAANFSKFSKDSAMELMVYSLKKQN